MLDTTRNADVGAALDDAVRRYASANPHSQRRHETATRWMPGGNTRTSLYYPPFPLTFTRGEGQRLIDLDGHAYTDLLGDYSAGLYGHSHPTIVAEARAALDLGLSFGGPNEYEAVLAQLISRRFRSIDLVRFTNSGTEANMLAIATARAMTGRSDVLVFDGGYHGSVLSFRGSSPLNAPFPFVATAFNDIDDAINKLEQYQNHLAAVIVEPMLGGAGAIPATGAFLRALRDHTARFGIALIFDEVMTSRLAPGGLQERYGITPDITTLGKYVGGGFAFGAFGGSRRAMERYDPSQPAALSHPGTFNNNIVTMAAGVAGLRDVYTPDVAVAHNLRGDALRERLNRLFTEAEVVMTATGIGSIIGIHFQTTPINNATDVVAADAKRALLHLEMIARGFYFARRGYLALSLALEPADIDGFVMAMTDVIREHRLVLQEEAP